jgi:hypothetical protein
MHNNTLTNHYANMQNKRHNDPFFGNPILASNPQLKGQMNQNFMNKINMAKLEQFRRYKTMDDAKQGMGINELVKYIINPIEIKKLTSEEKMEIDIKFKDKDSTYTNLKNYTLEEADGKMKTIVSKNAIPQEILDLWNTRTNNPYKQILHKLEIDDYTKKLYSTKDDLIIHKTSALDKAADIKILKKELKKLKKLVGSHNKELKAIYSTDKRSEFLEKFEYANKYKNRIKYDPKDNNELKEIYKREQKKLSKESKRIDYMMELYMASDDITKEDRDELKQIQDKEEKLVNEYKKNMDLFEENDLNEMRKNKKTIIVDIPEKNEERKIIDKSIIDKYKNRNSEIITETQTEASISTEKPSIQKSLIDKYKNRK